MPTWVKVVLVVVIVGFIGVAVAVVMAARWVKSRGAELERGARATVEEAERFGRGKDADACVAEALTRVRACDGFICEAKTNAFLQTCLRVSNVPAAFCNGVPKPTEIMQTARWQLAECARRGARDDQRCARLIGALQTYCSQR